MNDIVIKFSQSSTNTDSQNCTESPVFEFRVKGKTFTFNGEPSLELIAGRDRNCDIVIDHNSVSRQHARIVYEKNTLWIEDIGSKNGTFIKGRRINDRTELAEEFALGDVFIKVRRVKKMKKEKLFETYALIALFSCILALAGIVILFEIFMYF